MNENDKKLFKGDLLDEERLTRRFFPVPYRIVLENKENILEMNDKINWAQFTKFQGDTSFGLWFVLYNGAWDMLAVARIRADMDDNVYVNEFDARSGFGKEMMDTLYNHFKYEKQNYPELANAKKFSWDAINDKVAEHYKKNYTEYTYTGKNPWGYDHFERRF